MLLGTQLQLFDVGHPPRPQRFNHDILELLLDEIAPRAFTILGTTVTEDWNSIRDDLQSAVEFQDEPHVIEEFLVEHCYWDASVELRALLSEIEGIRNDLHEYQVKRWVLQNGISPQYSKGQQVTFQRQEERRGDEIIWLGEDTTYLGEIVGVFEETAEYLVFCEEFGHVRGQKDRSGILLPFEAVQRLDPTV
jgi:hypothetical protein